MENNIKLKELLTQYPNVITITEKDGLLRLKPTDEIHNIDVEKFINEIYALESELANEGKNNIGLDLKGLDIETLEAIIKTSLHREDLSDPIMILNILNLIKIYNTLNDNYFTSENVYFQNTEMLLDVRLDLQEELEAFIKQLSIYFISLFKSYNKVTYTPTDIHKKLPKIYKTIFLSSDFLTLSGIFASSEPFSTSECIYLEDAIECMYTLEQKSAIGYSLISNMIEGLSHGRSNKTDSRTTN